MPGMDGFEVCRRLKADPGTAPIPVLIVTSMAERSVRIKGVAAGADDFLTKPIDCEELVLRVRNAVYRKHLYDELAKKYAELKAMAELRKSLTNMINADTDALSLLMRDRLQPDRPAEGKPDGAHANEGSQHGTH
jgi:DNA-binding response OmpR family regulator